MDFNKLLKGGELALAENEIENPSDDAWYLLSHVTGFDRTKYYMHSQEEAPDKQCADYMALISKRAEHIPLQYIIGSTEFYGLPFEVDENVLIPRQDTETLVEEALKVTKDGDRVLDLCTGSGCVLLTIMCNRDGIDGTGVDISDGALSIARRNADNLKQNPKWICTDLFENVEGLYNSITANPPYIETEVISGLMPEVKDFEPMTALDGGFDGLDLYPRLINGAKERLFPGGSLLVEIGYNQGEAVKKLFEEAGFEQVEVIKDLPGQDRVVKGIYNV